MRFWKQFFYRWICGLTGILILFVFVHFMGPYADKLATFSQNYPYAPLILIAAVISGLIAYIATIGEGDKEPNDQVQKKLELILLIEREQKELRTELWNLRRGNSDTASQRIRDIRVRLGELDQALHDLRHWEVR